ncbi:gtp-binding protein- [Stylonychia lemnae]|uniref:Gtp-binding protein n=1 Tax=Stylonychia lemnae TaxID=5949 RepID=A0A078AF69_STYLE|nr:gtp-binding protein- [Stylonychia lemnae]|eukprot:CDW80860.1 gtp-binding protein- [Stylonychia lemnae]
MPKIRKRTTRRVTLKKKYSIQKSAKDTKRKIKKEAKKMQKRGILHKNTKKEVVIPNSYPYKEELMNEAEKKMQEEKDIKAHQKALEKANAQLPKGETHFAQVIKGNVKKQEEEKLQDGLTHQEIAEAERLIDPQASKVNNVYQYKKGYAKEVRKLVEQSDIVIEMLDARDPEGSRNHDLEKECQELNKKVVLVINKIDLVSDQNAQQWQKKLSKSHECILFKAPKKRQSQDEDEEMKDEEQEDEIIGLADIIKILKTHSKKVCVKEKLKDYILVGVIGQPNTGKSTLIRVLRKERAPDALKDGQKPNPKEIRLHKNIAILSTKGLVFPDPEQYEKYILRQAIKIEEIKDPIQPIQHLINKVEKQELLRHFRIADFKDVNELLGHIAKKKGHLQAGGKANMDQAARAIIREFLHGKIKYSSNPKQ